MFLAVRLHDSPHTDVHFDYRNLKVSFEFKKKKKGGSGGDWTKKERHCISNSYVQPVIISVRIPIKSVSLYDHLIYADHCAFRPV